MKITPVILCGGSGSRLWPLSRAGFPKQFLVLSGTNSLFQQAVERISGLAAEDISINETLVTTNEEHRFFNKIIPLAHPRYIMQYKRKLVDEYIDDYLGKFNK